MHYRRGRSWIAYTSIFEGMGKGELRRGFFEELVWRSRQRSGGWLSRMLGRGIRSDGGIPLPLRDSSVESIRDGVR